MSDSTTTKKWPSASSSVGSARLDFHSISGASAGFIATLGLHPLDLIKTRFHVQDRGSRRLPQYAGLLDAVRTIHRLEGWRGFYGGLTPNILGNTASWGVYMYAYNRCKDSLADRGVSGSPLYLGAATVAGALTTMLLHPVFTVKTRLQLQMQIAEPAAAVGALSAAPAAAQQQQQQQQLSKLVPASQRDNYSGTINAVRRMVAEEGLVSLYRGIGPSMLLVSHGSIQFLAYEQIKAEMLRRRAAAALPTASDSPPAWTPAVQLGANELLVASAASKVCAIIGTYPYQVVRSCMQQRAQVGTDTIAASYMTTSGTVRHIWRADGAFGFYRGIFAHMLRSTPQATVTLMLYEYLNRVLNYMVS